MVVQYTTLDDWASLTRGIADEGSIWVWVCAVPAACMVVPPACLPDLSLHELELKAFLN